MRFLQLTGFRARLFSAVCTMNILLKRWHKQARIIFAHHRTLVPRLRPNLLPHAKNLHSPTCPPGRSDASKARYPVELPLHAQSLLTEFNGEIEALVIQMASENR